MQRAVYNLLGCYWRKKLKFGSFRCVVVSIELIVDFYECFISSGAAQKWDADLLGFDEA